jgi:hypothetical protein
MRLLAFHLCKPNIVPSSICTDLPSFKQAAAIIGDATFQAPRRWFLRSANDNNFNQTWTYLFNETTPGAKEYLGGTSGFYRRCPY